jgi:hypothetical protein
MGRSNPVRGGRSGHEGNRVFDNRRERFSEPRPRGSGCHEFKLAMVSSTTAGVAAATTAAASMRRAASASATTASATRSRGAGVRLRSTVVRSTVLWSVVMRSARRRIVVLLIRRSVAPWCRGLVTRRRGRIAIGPIALLRRSVGMLRWRRSVVHGWSAMLGFPEVVPAVIRFRTVRKILPRCTTRFSEAMPAAA